MALSKNATQKFVKSILQILINLFVTSKNETTNSPIHEFKVLQKSLNEKARLRMFSKVINKK